MRPERRTDTPVLTGLYGFRWPESEMDAKCVLRENSNGESNLSRHKVDRHHRVIPDPDCSCGIYAGADEPTAGRDPLPPRRTPFVTGFVALTGRVLHDGSLLRAQHATIVGPLSLALGRRPRWHRLAPGATSGMGARVTTNSGAYRTVWTKRDNGEAAVAWLSSTAAALTRRYGATVEITRAA